jgi:putative membrane protein
VETGRLALQKSSNADVTAFFQSMIGDRTRGLDATKKIAAAKKVALPAEPDAAHGKMAEELNSLSSTNFDKQYVEKAGVRDHTKVRAALKADVSETKDVDASTLATKLEPTVAHHLAMSVKLQTAIK